MNKQLSRELENISDRLYKIKLKELSDKNYSLVLYAIYHISAVRTIIKNGGYGFE